MTNAEQPKRENLLTIALEDYFQVGAFNRLIQHGQWYRFETRLEQNLQRTLDLLAQYDVQATFFVLGWIAEHYPELVKRIVEAGHEIGSRGYYHRNILGMSKEEFREDLLRTQEVLQWAGRSRVHGYRLADGWLGPNDLWVLDVLAEEGYAYDSSIAPRWREFAQTPWRRFPHEHTVDNKTLLEFPIPTLRLLRWTLPIGGGNYFRQFPHWMMRKAFNRWHRHYQVPFLMYFHTWELDPDQPKISSASWMTRMRHYRNLHLMQEKLEHYFQQEHFQSISSYLKLDSELPEAQGGNDTDPEIMLISTLRSGPQGAVNRERVPLTVVIPCYNEETTLSYLSRTLESVYEAMSSEYELTFLFVNDGSSDKTREKLQELFGDCVYSRIIEHEQNQGVAAAILTGIRAARTELVCSIDADCTYDPHEIASLLPRLTDGVDMVTASPYHPEGEVCNVPGWRLFLSKGSSFLYRRVLRQKLHTYTSCFRLFRRSAMLKLDVQEKGFLGIAEMLGKLDLEGGMIVEHPAVLEVRLLGHSKMKTVRTILGHLKLMTKLLWRRLRGKPDHVKPTQPFAILDAEETETLNQSEKNESNKDDHSTFSQESVI